MANINQFVEALVDTAIKLSPIADSTLLPPSDMFLLKKGEKLAIKAHQDAPNNHQEIELKIPKNGHEIWFAFKPDIKICLVVARQR
jgi:hypothetical protein